MRLITFSIILLTFGTHVFATTKSQVAQLLDRGYKNQVDFYPGAEMPFLIDFDGDKISEIVVFVRESTRSFKKNSGFKVVDLAEGRGKGELGLAIIKRAKKQEEFFLFRNFDEIGIADFTEKHARAVKRTSNPKLFNSQGCKGDVLFVFTESSAPMYVCWNGTYKIFGDPDDLP